MNVKNIIGLNCRQLWYFKPFGLWQASIQTAGLGENSQLMLPMISQSQVNTLTAFIEKDACSIQSKQDNASEFQEIKPLKLKNLVKAALLSPKYLFFFVLVDRIQALLNVVGIQKLPSFFLHKSELNKLIGELGLVILFVSSALLKQYLDYRNFKLKFNDEMIDIANGVLATNQGHLNKKDVLGLHISKTVSEHILNLSSVEVLSKHNLGDAKTKINEVLPYTSDEGVAQLLSQILGGWPCPDLGDKNKRALKIVGGLLILLGVVSLITFFDIKRSLINLLVICLLLILVILLSYFQRELEIDGDYIKYHFGMFVHSAYIVKRKQIEWIRQVEIGPFILTEVAIYLDHLRHFRVITRKR